MSDKPKPTEAEIAAAREVWSMDRMTIHEITLIIARHNAPLHKRIAAQKAALELAQKAIEESEFKSGEKESRCPDCYGGKNKGHRPHCLISISLAAIKEALS